MKKLPVSLKDIKRILKQCKKAFKNNDVALVQGTNKKTGKLITVLCAVYVDEEELYNFIPLAKMFDGNPYDEVEFINKGGSADEMS